MPYDVMSRLFLNKYHQTLKDWYCLVGEFFERTNGWTKPYIKNVLLNDILLIVSWNDYSWEVEEIK